MQRIIAFSVHSRWLVVLVVALVGAFGLYALAHLPIDAVPDITNNQVQINARAPALSAFEMEKQVTYPIENALADLTPRRAHEHTGEKRLLIAPRPVLPRIDAVQRHMPHQHPFAALGMQSAMR